jgi:hypothetical protein
MPHLVIIRAQPYQGEVQPYCVGQTGVVARERSLGYPPLNDTIDKRETMKNTWRFGSGPLLVALVMLVSGTAHAGVPVNGISDQHVDTWPAPAVWWSTGLGFVRYARRNVRWDVGREDSRATIDEANAVTTWLASVRSLGLTPLISFDLSGTCASVADSGASGICTPGGPAYRSAVEAFRAHWPEVTEFTPWNEPNHSRLDGAGTHQLNPIGTGPFGATRAAGYYLTLRNVCASPPPGVAPCTVIAGDITDESGASAYLNAYRAVLGVTPATWAFHGYGYANSATGVLASLQQAVAPARVWVTEVGAYRCRNKVPLANSEQTQRLAARRIASLRSMPNVDRVYYYEFYAPGRFDLSNGCLDYDDTTLLNRDSIERPALRVIRNGVPIPMLFKDGVWNERFSFANANQPNRTVLWGQAGDQPVLGDWDGDGVETPGVLRGNTWWLTNDPVALDGARWTSFVYGSGGDTALVGDWNGDGVDTVGVRHGNTFYLSNTNSSAPSTYGFSFGDLGDPVVVGNWDGDASGTDGVGVVKGDAWYVKNTLSGSAADDGWFYGAAGDKPVVGDWDGDGQDDPGVYRGIGGMGAWFLGKQHQQANLAGFWSYFGDGSEFPLAG